MCFTNTVCLGWWIFQFVGLDNPAPLFVEMGYQASVAKCLVSLPEGFAVKSSLFILTLFEMKKLLQRQQSTCPQLLYWHLMFVINDVGSRVALEWEKGSQVGRSELQCSSVQIPDKEHHWCRPRVTCLLVSLVYIQFSILSGFRLNPCYYSLVILKYSEL